MIILIKEFKDYLKGGLADKLTLKDIANKHNVSLEKIEKELQLGINVELEHTNDKNLAYEIAKDHLTEMPNYYTKLKVIEN